MDTNTDNEYEALVITLLKSIQSELHDIRIEHKDTQHRFDSKILECERDMLRLLEVHYYTEKQCDDEITRAIHASEGRVWSRVKIFAMGVTFFATVLVAAIEYAPALLAAIQGHKQ